MWLDMIIRGSELSLQLASQYFCHLPTSVGDHVLVKALDNLIMPVYIYCNTAISATNHHAYSISTVNSHPHVKMINLFFYYQDILAIEHS